MFALKRRRRRRLLRTIILFMRTVSVVVYDG